MSCSGDPEIFNLLARLAGLAGIWFLVVTIPGPNFAAVTRLAMSRSRKSGLLVALGVSTGAMVWAGAGLLGLGGLLQSSAGLYRILRLAGGAYLTYLGLKTIWGALKPPTDRPETGNIPVHISRGFRRGLFTSFSNPKTAVFFGSLFIVAFPAQAPVWFLLAALVMVFSVSIIWYSLVACFFSISPVRIIYARLKRLLNGLTGGILVYFGFRVMAAE